MLTKNCSQNKFLSKSIFLFFYNLKTNNRKYLKISIIIIKTNHLRPLCVRIEEGRGTGG